MPQSSHRRKYTYSPSRRERLELGRTLAAEIREIVDEFGPIDYVSSLLGSKFHTGGHSQ